MLNFFEFLREVPFFRSLSDSDIMIIQETCKEKSYKKGDIICTEGEMGYDLFIIFEGSVEIWKNYKSLNKDLLSVYGPGQIFGELSLIDDSPRSATVIARQKCRLLSINRDDFNLITMSNPISKSIMRYLSNMIRKRTETFTQGLHIRNRQLERAYEKSRKMEEKYRILVKEKTCFNNEIHHQIINNLQLFTNILQIQMNHIQNENLLEACQKNINNINLLKLLHEIQFQNPGHSGIQVFSYFQKLAANFCQILGISQNNIQLDIIEQNILLLPKEAFVLGLILNELLSAGCQNNSFDSAQYSVLISFKVIEKEEVEFSITRPCLKNIKGFDETDSLRINMVKKFAEDQLGKSFQIEEDGQIRFIIRFTPKIMIKYI